MKPVYAQVPCLAWGIASGRASTRSGNQAASVAAATTPTMLLTAWRRVNLSSTIVVVRSSNHCAMIISFCTENDDKNAACSFYDFDGSVSIKTPVEWRDLEAVIDRPFRPCWIILSNSIIWPLSPVG